MQDSEELPASARELEPAVGQRPKHKRRGRVVTVLALGGVVALVTKEDLRSRLLDAVFGPEEQFEYDSVTEPVAPGIEPEGAAMFPQGAEEVPTAEAGTQDDALWSIPTPHAEAGRRHRSQTTHRRRVNRGAAGQRMGVAVYVWPAVTAWGLGRGLLIGARLYPGLLAIRW